MHVRAVHLEVAHSLEADSFIMALRRFLARRGNPARILSDNGNNFFGAERELRESVLEIDQKRVADELSARCVQ
jgi:lipase chaperone LimK